MVRFYSPMETIGGGVILEPNPGVKKRFHQDVIDELKRKESGSVADVIELHIRERGKTLITLAELAKMTALSEQEIQGGGGGAEEPGADPGIPAEEGYLVLARGFQAGGHSRRSWRR